MSDRLGLLIVGGGPAGFAAAKAYREVEPHRAVAIVSDEQLMPYSRPPLTKEFLRGQLDAAELPIDDESWLERQRVSLVGGRAVALDPDARSVTLSGGRALRYDDCLLATGAEPKRLPVPGADHPAVRTVRALHDVLLLLDRLHEHSRVAVIGSGFIGCEIASSLRVRGNPVSLVSNEPAPNAARLGDEAAAIVAAWLRDDGVELHLGVEVERIDHRDQVTTVVTGDESVEADIVVLAAGVCPRGELAVQAGLELSGGAVPVDPSMRTRRNGLLAAGDVCMAENRAAGRALRVEHWGDALTQGEIAGRTAGGDQAAAWDSVPGFWSTIGERTLKYAGWGDGFDEVSTHRHPDGGFTCWYLAKGRLAGVLTHDADDDYERGEAAIGHGTPWTI